MNSTQNNSPLLIAGPCSAESRQQLFETANALLKEGKVDFFRAGVWKPRTSPNSFEGVGAEALDWLIDVQQELNIPVITEVANSLHVEQALQKGVKNIWIGARTSVSPFAVQEIAEVVRGEDVKVMVKNPMHPDVDLWEGAINRFWKVGINPANVMAIHRGFASLRNSRYRNVPMWEIPIELQRRHVDLRIICDPSHIAGKSALVEELCQKAIDLNMGGLMIETHMNPDSALSDAKQQIKPVELFDILNRLQLKREDSSDALFLTQLEDLRAKVDKMDEDLIETLKARMDLVKLLGEFKREHKVTAFQLERWNEILDTRTSHGRDLGLDQNFISEMMERIHSESIKIQLELINGAPKNASS